MTVVGKEKKKIRKHCGGQREGKERERKGEEDIFCCDHTCLGTASIFNHCYAMSASLGELETQLEQLIETTRQLGIIVSDFQPQGQPVLNQKM